MAGNGGPVTDGRRSCHLANHHNTEHLSHRQQARGTGCSLCWTAGRLPHLMLRNGRLLRATEGVHSAALSSVYFQACNQHSRVTVSSSYSHVIL